MTRERYEADPKRCLRCGEAIPFEQRDNVFCGHSCAASVRNVTVKRREAKRCVRCGCPVRERQNTYCDDCIKQRVFNKNLRLQDCANDKSRRRWLLDKRGRRCENCGLREWLNQPIPLEMHHIDGNTDNNDEENLILLCPNCHALTPTHKHRNVLKEGKRQLMRRKRYQDGQTW
jgi:hypothetical protein